MSTLNKVTKTIAKILEVLCFIGAGIALICTIACVAFNGQIASLIASNFDTITVGGLSAADAGVTPDSLAHSIIAIFIGGIITSSLVAMIFRNIHLIFQTTEGKTWFSKGETPFQADNVRMVREIGIFAIAIPFVELISGFAYAALAQSTFHGSLNLTSLIFGLVILCLS